MNKFISLTLLFLFIFILYGCSTTQNITDFDLQHVLAKVDALLNGYQSEAHCITIGSDFMLSIWVMLPELDNNAIYSNVNQNTQIAIHRGFKIVQLCVVEIPEIKNIFDGINPMIVDQGFNTWYIGFIPIQSIPMDINIDDSELISALEYINTEQTYKRFLPSQEGELYYTLNTDQWAETRACIQALFKRHTGRQNVAAYPLISHDILLIQVYWDTYNTEESHIKQEIIELACILSDRAIKIDKLEVYITKSNGRLLAYGRVFGKDINTKHGHLTPVDIFLVYQ